MWNESLVQIILFNYANLPCIIAAEKLLSACYQTRLDSLWPSDAIRRRLDQVMVCCLTKPRNYINQCWINEEVVKHSPGRAFISKTQNTPLSNMYESCYFEMTANDARGQWVKNYISVVLNVCRKIQIRGKKPICHCQSPEIASSLRICPRHTEACTIKQRYDKCSRKYTSPLRFARSSKV